MNNPILVCQDNFAYAWSKAIIELNRNLWNAWNLVITICRPDQLDDEAVALMTEFAQEQGLVLPWQVQHTIFPQRMYKQDRIKNRQKLYKCYNRFYRFTRKMPHRGWGTYFKRMISYTQKNGEEYDQLGNIIDKINNSASNYGASHIIFIPQIGVDTNRRMGSPCLNYITVQVEKTQSNRTISLLAVYRNHDFRERAFGNYWGLCSLLKYMCTETDSMMGSITCISSHAYVNTNKTELFSIAEKIAQKYEK